MKSTDGLGDIGKGVYERVMLNVEDGDRLHDAAHRYAFQVEIGELARRKWHKLGEPLLAENSNGAIYVHPLIRVMQDADATAHRFGQPLRAGKKHRGPDPKAVVAPQTSEAEKLRSAEKRKKAKKQGLKRVR